MSLDLRILCYLKDKELITNNYQIMEKLATTKTKHLREPNFSQDKNIHVIELRIIERPSLCKTHYRNIISGYGACRKCGCKGFEHVIGNGWMCGNCGHKKEDHF